VVLLNKAIVGLSYMEISLNKKKSEESTIRDLPAVVMQAQEKPLNLQLYQQHCPTMTTVKLIGVR
jgi:hypothetical protein